MLGRLGVRSGTEEERGAAAARASEGRPDMLAEAEESTGEGAGTLGVMCRPRFIE